MKIVEESLETLNNLGFSSFYGTILKKIIKSFADKYRQIEYYYDNDLEFVDKINEITNLKASMTFSGKLDNNYPAMYACQYQIADINLGKVTGFACDLLNHNNELVKLKAKAELLERLTIYMPIDSAKGFNFSPEIFAEKFNDKKVNIVSVLNSKKLKINIKDIYLRIVREIHDDASLNKNIITSKKEMQVTSNGCAGHFDFNKALVAAWLECIQRDGFLMYWLNTISPKSIDIEGYLEKVKNNKDTEKLRNLISGFKKYKIEYCLLDITSDIDVPNVLCVVWTYDGEGNRRITLGASTNFNPLAAIESAILEAIATLCTRHNDMDFSMDDFKNYIPFTDTNIEKEARVKFYFNKNVSKYIDFLIANKISSGIEKSSSHKEVSISVEDWASVSGAMGRRGFDQKRLVVDTKHQLAYLKSLFKEKMEQNPEYNVYLYEYNNKIIKHFDFKVVRVICPALYSLYLNENYADPNHPRLKEFITNKGLESEAKLNIWPHPFP